MNAYVLAAIVTAGAVLFGVFASNWIYTLTGSAELAVLTVGILAGLWGWAIATVAMRAGRRGG